MRSGCKLLLTLIIESPIFSDKKRPSEPGGRGKGSEGLILIFVFRRHLNYRIIFILKSIKNPYSTTYHKGLRSNEHKKLFNVYTLIIESAQFSNIFALSGLFDVDNEISLPKPFERNRGLLWLKWNDFFIKSIQLILE